MKRLSLREAWPYLKDLQQDPLAVLLEWGRAHPRLFLPLPRFPLALIFDPEGVEGALLAEGTTKATFQYRALSRLTGRGLLTDWGKSWKEARKALKDPFLPKSVRGYREAMEEEAWAFFGEWRGRSGTWTTRCSPSPCASSGGPSSGSPSPQASRSTPLRP